MTDRKGTSLASLRNRKGSSETVRSLTWRWHAYVISANSRFSVFVELHFLYSTTPPNLHCVVSELLNRIARSWTVWVRSRCGVVELRSQRATEQALSRVVYRVSVEWMVGCACLVVA